MKKIILHIPHSSTFIPTRKDYLVSSTELRNEVIKLTDWYTDDLFQHKNAISIITPFSRLFCDVERFPNDKDEIMSKYGMGMFYTTLDNGKILRKDDKITRSKIFNQFYQKHHKKLLQKVEKVLKINKKCLIIDCHSFSDVPFERDIKKKLPRPDIDIGIDNFHTSKILLNIVKKYCEKNGLSFKINEPYSGTIIPLKYYRKNKQLQSIMIEVNRRLYLEKNSNKKNKNYKKVKRVLLSMIDEIIKEF